MEEEGEAAEVVSKWRVRAIFNEHYLQKIERREALEEVVASNHPSKPLAQEPFCTESQRVRYSVMVGDTLVTAAICHRYLRTSGELGASGRPDPKEVLFNGRWYIADPG